MNQKSKNILQCLPLLASTLARTYGIRVEIGGDTACTDGKTIYLPALPLDGDETLLNLVRGYIDHEAAHIRYTDFQALREANFSPFEEAVWNCAEDWRIEREISRLYPGCEANLQWLIRHIFYNKNERKAGDENPALSLINYLLYRVRAMSVHSLLPECEQFAGQIESNWPGLCVTLDQMIDALPHTIIDTLDTITFAKEYIQAIRDYVGSTELFDKTGIDHNDGPGQSSPQFDLESLLSISDLDLPEDFGQQVGSILEQQAQNPSTLRLEVAPSYEAQASPLPRAQVLAAQIATNALSRRLYGLLQSKTLSEAHPSRTGKLDGNLLYRLAICDAKVFRKNGVKLKPNTAVHLLLDSSGSMVTRIEVACGVCYALARSMKNINGVSVGVSAFPVITGDRPGIAHLLKHGHKLTENFNVPAGGCTPLAEAILNVIQTLAPRSEGRKIVMVITDGDPDSFTTARETIGLAEKLDIEMCGVGIMLTNTEQISKLFTIFCEVNRMEDLSDVAFKMLQTLLLQRISAYRNPTDGGRM